MNDDEATMTFPRVILTGIEQITPPGVATDSHQQSCDLLSPGYSDLHGGVLLAELWGRCAY